MTVRPTNLVDCSFHAVAVLSRVEIHHHHIARPNGGSSSSGMSLRGHLGTLMNEAVVGDRGVQQPCQLGLVLLAQSRHQLLRLIVRLRQRPAIAAQPMRAT